MKDCFFIEDYKKVYKKLSCFLYPMYKVIKGEVGMNVKKFAQGYNLYKLFWIFFLSSFIGACIEIVWCYFVMGKFMSRSSLLYGQFSIVWGLGCVLLTVLLHKLQGKRNLYVFLIGAFAGGIYEYICTIFTEVFFGVRFWDYSDIAFNINGRVNLLFCFFWGILAIAWIQIVYPYLSNKIEKIPLGTGKYLTWFLFTFLLFDIVLSTLALDRAYHRHMHIEANNQVEVFLDNKYTDTYLAKRYQNMFPR